MILLYHAIVSDSAPAERWCIGQALPQSSFERHVRWLSRWGSILPLPEYLAEIQKPLGQQKRIFALTFDDGLGCTYQFACPLLRSLQVPATFFISTCHLQAGRLLWFSYLNALCFESEYDVLRCDGHCLPLSSLEERKGARRVLGQMARDSGKPDTFCRQLARFHPLPTDLTEQYHGLSSDELVCMSRDALFEIGAHTVTHPYLSRVPRPVQSNEIFESRRRLHELTQQPVRYFAYPGGDYNEDTIALVKEAGYEAAFATIPHELEPDSRFEIGRVGIYSKSLVKVCLKAMGITSLLERVGIATG